MSHDEPPIVVPHFRGWKPPKRSSEDSYPIPLQQVNCSLATDIQTINRKDNDETAKPCNVCKQSISRYTCPRCQIPYCSVDCYRNHTSQTSSSSSSSQVSSCTENFYHNRVASIVRLETLEQKDNTAKILNQQHELLNMQEEEEISDELYEILLALEEEQDDGPTQKQLLSMMSPSLRAVFESDLRNGKVQELVLEEWYPWWRRQLVSTATSDEDVPSSSVPEKTLDEQLLNVPQFSTLFRKGNPPNLLFNLVEILYSICWTLRLYHGKKNATFLSIDAITTLISSSSVLNSDARFTKLEQVLSDCTALSTKEYPAGCNEHWTVLAEDVALILGSQRLVGRALLEASDLLKEASKQTKKQIAHRDGERGEGPSTRLRRIRKKVDFYLSWSQQATFLGTDCKEEILAWIEQWKDADESTELDDLQIPLDPAVERSSSSQPSSGEKNVESPSALMVEVETKRKIVELVE